MVESRTVILRTTYSKEQRKWPQVLRYKIRKIEHQYLGSKERSESKHVVDQIHFEGMKKTKIISLL
jgi:hypothetical protein